MPELMRIAKSPFGKPIELPVDQTSQTASKIPNSWGNSSHMTAMLMLMPFNELSEKAAPMLRPS
jgi:hypothetical protein